MLTVNKTQQKSKLYCQGLNTITDVGWAQWEDYYGMEKVQVMKRGVDKDGRKGAEQMTVVNVIYTSYVQQPTYNGRYHETAMIHLFTINTEPTVTRYIKTSDTGL